MGHNFQSSILRVVVGQVCEAVGYNSITQQSLEILVDLLRNRIILYGSLSAELCNLNSRVEPTIYDVLRAFKLLRVSIDGLQDHISNVEIPPIPLKIRPNYPAKPVNRIQRHLLIDDLLEATKNKANVSDSAAVDSEEAAQQNSTPSSTLMKDMFADVLNSFKDVAPVSADKTIRPPSPRSVSTVIKIKKTASPLPDENKVDHLLHQSTTSRPKTLAERKALPLDLDTKSFLKISRRQIGEKKRGRKSLKETKEREKEDLRALKKKMASKTVMKAVKLSKKEKSSKDKSKKIKKSSLNQSPGHSPLPTDNPIKIPKKRGRKPKKDKLLAEESVTPQKKVGRVKSGKKLKLDKRRKKTGDKMKVKLDKEKSKSENNVNDDAVIDPEQGIPADEMVDVPPKKIEKKRGRKSKKELEALALAEQKALLAKIDSEDDKRRELEMEQEKRLEKEREEMERTKREEEKEREREVEREKEREKEREREREREKKILEWEREQQEKEKERQKEKEREAEEERQREKEREKTKTKDRVKEKVDTGFSGEVTKKKKKAGKAGRKKKNQCIIITETVDTEDAPRTDEQEWFCPACGKADDGSLMLECETCKNWYHFSCTALTKQPDEEEDWFCDLCLQAALKSKQSKAKEVKVSKDRRDSKENKEKSRDPKPSTSKVPTEVIPEAADSDDAACPVCNKTDDGSLMLQCEDPDCAKWFHGSCVNIYVTPSETEPWFCKKCVEKQQLYLNTAYDKRKRRK